jgi:hypothetical protein
VAFALQLRKKHGKTSVRVAAVHHKQTVQYSTITMNSTTHRTTTNYTDMRNVPTLSLEWWKINRMHAHNNVNCNITITSHSSFVPANKYVLSGMLSYYAAGKCKPEYNTEIIQTRTVWKDFSHYLPLPLHADRNMTDVSPHM